MALCCCNFHPSSPQFGAGGGVPGKYCCRDEPKPGCWASGWESGLKLVKHWVNTELVKFFWVHLGELILLHPTASLRFFLLNVFPGRTSPVHVADWDDYLKTIPPPYVAYV